MHFRRYLPAIETVHRRRTANKKHTREVHAEWNFTNLWNLIQSEQEKINKTKSFPARSCFAFERCYRIYFHQINKNNFAAFLAEKMGKAVRKRIFSCTLLMAKRTCSAFFQPSKFPRQIQRQNKNDLFGFFLHFAAIVPQKNLIMRSIAGTSAAVQSERTFWHLNKVLCDSSRPVTNWNSSKRILAALEGISTFSLKY